MGFFHQPNLVNDGLVLALDAADKVSYPNSGSIWHDLCPLPNTSANARKFLDLNGGAGAMHHSGSESYFDFDGSNGWAELNAAGGAEDAHLDFGTGDFTHEIVIQADSVSGDIGLIVKGGAGATGVGMTIRSGGRLGTSIDAPDNTHLHSSAAALSTGKKYHCLISYDRSDNAHVFINGENVVNSDISGQNQSVNTNGHLYIAAYNDTNWHFNGKVYLARIYNKALNDNQALNNYHVLKSRFNLGTGT